MTQQQATRGSSRGKHHPDEPIRNTLHITDASGDTRVMWDPSNRDEVKVAKAAFDAAKKQGMVGYAVDDETGKAKRGEVIAEFDPTAGKIIMTRQLQGG